MAWDCALRVQLVPTTFKYAELALLSLPLTVLCPGVHATIRMSIWLHRHLGTELLVAGLIVPVTLDL